MPDDSFFTATESCGFSGASSNLPIGVFDSGVGGLTVLAAIRKALPQEHLLYLGDTARLPYGTKSIETVTRYAVQAAGALVERGIKLLVIACNTATAAALPALQKAFSGIPVIGVVDPGARAACAATKNRHILVIATDSTIENGAYQKAICAIDPNNTVIAIACPLFVALAEAGWVGVCGPEVGGNGHVEEERNIVRAVATRYFSHIFAENDAAKRPDCMVLGCTHFPPLASAIRAVVGSDVMLVDSAATTAQAVQECLRSFSLERLGGVGTWHFLTTDSPERFRRVGSLFLGLSIDESAIELVSL